MLPLKLSKFERGGWLMATLTSAPDPPLLLYESLVFNLMAYILDLIIMIMARMVAIATEDRVRYRLDDFNHFSSTPKPESLSKKICC